MDTTGSLANPALWDILGLRVLPRLTVGALGYLRGTCTSLRDLLDDDLSHPIWAAAAQHLLPIASSVPVKSHQQQQAAQEAPASISIQKQLRQQAALAGKLRAPGDILHWPARSLFEIDTDCLEWSPCSRWVAAVQMSCGHWRITIWDTLTRSQSCIQPNPNQQVVHMQWLQQPGWLLYLTGYTKHTTRCTRRVLVTSNVQTGKEYKAEVDAIGGPRGVEAIRNCLACGRDVVAWVLQDAKAEDEDLREGRVALLHLPSLKQRAILTSINPEQQFATPRRMWFSPNSALLAVQWVYTAAHIQVRDGSTQIRRRHILHILHLSSGSTVGPIEVPWEAGLSWSPTSDKIFGICGIVEGTACILDIKAAQRRDVGLIIRPRAPMQQGWGWMPDGQLIIAHGALTRNAHFEVSFCWHPTAWHLILPDGTIACSWPSPYEPHHVERPPLGEHPMGRIWSQGLPGFLQPHHPGLPFVVRQFYSDSMGSGWPTMQMGRSGSLHISRCGHVRVNILELDGDHADHPVATQCWQGSSNSAAQHVITETCSSSDRAVLSWHPGLSCVYALNTSQGEVMIAHGRSEHDSQVYSPRQLQNASRLLLQRKPKWQILRWSPDGTRLCISGYPGTSVIDFAK